jgi:hypothetical protein
MKSDSTAHLKRTFISTLLIVLMALPTMAQKNFKDKFSYRGYIKDLRVVAITPNGTTLQQNLIHNRLNFRYDLKPNLQAGLELRNRLFYGEFLKNAPGYGDLLEMDPGIVDMTWSWINNKEFVAHTAIDRLWVNWSNSKWDIRLGRQRINWGQNTVWNPNDLFNVLNYTDFDYEERPGSDALQVQRYFKKGGSIHAAYKFTDDFDESVFAAMYRFNKKQYDFQLLAGKYKQDLAVGLGWAGNLKGAGFKGEVTYFEAMTDSSESSLLSSFGIDFIIPKGPFISISALFNSMGVSELDKLLDLSSTGGGQLDVKNLMPNKYSAFISAGGAINALLSTNLAAIFALDIDGYFIMPSIDYSLKTNLDMSLIGQSFVGKKTKWENLSSAIFLRFKWSF